MQLKSREAMPDHWRRAVRLATATALLGSLGFSLAALPGYSRGPWVMVVKWALITLPVVTMPLLGKTSQVGAERVLGTILGGLLGFLASAISTNWWTQKNELDELFLAAAASAAAFFSVLAGKRFNLDLSARLFVIAFIIVSFNAQQGKDPFLVMTTRILGIVSGVATMLLMSVLILPKSASIESLRTLRKSLEKLREINAIAWGAYLPGPAPPGQAQAAATAGSAATAALPASRQQSKGGAAVWRATDGGDPELRQPLLGTANGGDLEAGGALAAGGTGLAAGPVQAAEAHEAVLLQSEKALTQLYALLESVQEQLGLARKEVWVCGCAGHPFLLPGMPFWSADSKHLPWRELEAVADAIRRVARLLNTALFMLQDGFAEQLSEVLGPLFPPDLLPTLAASADAAIQELVGAFPNEPAAASAGLAAFTSAVASLAAVSDQQRRQVVQALRRFRTRSHARASWAGVIDAALAQQATLEQAAPADGVPEAAADAASDAAAGEPRSVGREASLASWLRRISSGRRGSADSAAAAVQEAAGGAADGGLAGGKAGEIGQGEAAPGPALSAASSASSLTSSPFKAAAARERRGLPAALPAPPSDASLPLRPQLAASPQASGTGIGSRRSSLAGSAAALADTAGSSGVAFSPPQPAAGMARGASGQQLAAGSSGISAFAPGGSGSSLPASLFPETVEGHMAQVSWYSFQNLCEELEEQLQALHAAINAALARLP